jgi:HKD family nuclease
MLDISKIMNYLKYKDPSLFYKILSLDNVKYDIKK